MTESRPLRSTRRLQNLTGALPRWYNITKPSASGPTLISIYDEIGFYGVSAGAFMADLDGVAGDLEIHINSPGGDIYDGLTIYNRLGQRQDTIHVIVDGLAASAASFIAMAASPGQLEMAPRSEMMIHNGFTMAIGDAADLRKTADLLDRKTADIAGIYAARSGKAADYWLAKMAEETWLSAEETVAEGLADRIQGQNGPARNEWDLSVFAKYTTPAAPVAATTPLNADGTHAPHTGTHVHPHPAMDDQGGDDTHEHEHTHDGDADHGHAHDAPPANQAPPTPVAAAAPPVIRAPEFPVLNADFDSSPWDAAKAWHNGAESDDPAAFYKGICAGRKSGDASNQDAWALPYKYHPGDKPNTAGVKAALSRLPQTDGLTNAADAKALLQRLMKQINPEYEPEDFIDPELLAHVFSLGLEGAVK